MILHVLWGIPMNDFNRVIILVHPEADFQESFLVMGLVELLGEENVILYPPKYSYYGQVHRYPGITDPTKEGVTGPFEFFKPLKKSPEIDGFELFKQLKTCDLIVMTTRATSIKTYRELLELREQSPDIKLPPMIMVDSEDHQFLRTDLIQQFGPKVYFKRELVEEHERVYGDTKIFPLPMSSYVWRSIFADEAQSWINQPKEYNLTCVVGNTHPYRHEVITALKNANFPKSFIGIDGDVRTNTKEFLQRIALSKIAVSIRGHGQDTVRRWEIPSFKTLLLTDVLSIQDPYPYCHYTHCIYYRTPEECVTKAKHFLLSDNYRDIARNGFLHTSRYHSTKARAAFMLDMAYKSLLKT